MNDADGVIFEGLAIAAGIVAAVFVVVGLLRILAWVASLAWKEYAVAIWRLPKPAGWYCALWVGLLAALLTLGPLGIRWAVRTGIEDARASQGRR